MGRVDTDTSWAQEYARNLVQKDLRPNERKQEIEELKQAAHNARRRKAPTYAGLLEAQAKELERN